MVSDGIKAARIQARYSPLIGLTWEPVSFPVNIAAAVKNATTRLSPRRGGRRRQAGTPPQAGTPRPGARFPAGARGALTRLALSGKRPRANGTQRGGKPQPVPPRRVPGLRIPVVTVASFRPTSEPCVIREGG